MRKVLAALTVLTAALAVAPASTATSAPDVGAERVTAPVDRLGTLDAIRQRVVTLTNNRRRNHGCNNLSRNDALDRAAQTHTRKMANRNTLSHQLRGEASLGVRVRRAGYNWSLLAENIAAGYTTPEAVVRGWMNSRGHRRNILNCRFRHIGVGYAVSDRGTPYWTQVFGRR
jgi:uncharacterized protein YkwD